MNFHLLSVVTVVARQADLEDPSKSFDFIKACLRSTLPDAEIAYELSQFFDRLEDGFR